MSRFPSLSANAVIDLRDGVEPTVELRPRAGWASNRQMARSVWWALICIALLNALDVVSTHAVVARGGVELNPLTRALLGSGRIEMAKAVVLVGLGYRLTRRAPTLVLHAALWCTGGIYLITVLNNLLVLARLA